MIYPPLPPHRLVGHWLERHPNRTSFILHVIGIPPMILGVLLCSVYVALLSFSLFLVAVALCVFGWGLQFAGHGLEGTDPGRDHLLQAKARPALRGIPTPASTRSQQSGLSGPCLVAAIAATPRFAGRREGWASRSCGCPSSAWKKPVQTDPTEKLT